MTVTTTIERVCAIFSGDGYSDPACDGDEPDEGQRYCRQCIRAAEHLRTVTEDAWEWLDRKCSLTREARVEYERVMALCDEVLGANK